MERKLAAMPCADVYGYSRLMGEDEEATLRTLTSHRKLIDSQIEQHHGRFVNSAGDSVLAEFRQRGRGGELRRQDPGRTEG
jgi:adenylate cyclase